MGAPEPAITKTLFVRMLRSARMADEFIQAISVSWAYLLRAQSECLPVIRQMPSVRMEEESILKARPVIGMWNHQVVIKLRSRRKAPGGLRVIRKCICGRHQTGSRETYVPQVFCPV